MKDRPMSLDEALAVFLAAAEVDEHPSGTRCGVCGVPQQVWWTERQKVDHARYHRAQATVALAVAGQ